MFQDFDLNIYRIIQVHVVTKCINESIHSDVRLAESFIRVTYNKQMKRDELKREKVVYDNFYKNFKI